MISSRTKSRLLNHRKLITVILIILCAIAALNVLSNVSKNDSIDNADKLNIAHSWTLRKEHINKGLSLPQPFCVDTCIEVSREWTANKELSRDDFINTSRIDNKPMNMASDTSNGNCLEKSNGTLTGLCKLVSELNGYTFTLNYYDPDDEADRYTKDELEGGEYDYVTYPSMTLYLDK